MNSTVLQMREPDQELFAPFGHLVTPPDEPGRRKFYSNTLQVHPPASAPVLHVNHVVASTLPLEVSGIERHPQAAQCFFPIDVSRYAILVFASDEGGQPRLDEGLALLMPGTMGVIFKPNVWHLGATVLDRPGHFTVLMWRGGVQQDDEFKTIAPITLVAPE